MHAAGLRVRRRGTGTVMAHTDPVKRHHTRGRVSQVGIGNSIKHSAEQAAGKVKQAAGRVRGDTPQANAGTRQQKRANLKKAGDQAKRAMKRK